MTTIDINNRENFNEEERDNIGGDAYYHKTQHPNIPNRYPQYPKYLTVFTNSFEIVTGSREFKNYGGFILFIVLTAIYIAAITFTCPIKSTWSFVINTVGELFTPKLLHLACLGMVGGLVSGIVFLSLIRIFHNYLYILIIVIAITKTIGFTGFLISKGTFSFSSIILLICIWVSILAICHNIYKHRRILGALSKASVIEIFNNFDVYIIGAFINIFIIGAINGVFCVYALLSYFSNNENNLFLIATLYMVAYTLIVYIISLYSLTILFSSSIHLSLHNKNRDENLQVNRFSYSFYSTLMAFGSICFAAVIEGTLKIMSFLLRNEIKRRSRDSRFNGDDSLANKVVMIFLYILLFVLSLFESLFKIYNSFAMVDLAATGNEYYDAMKNSFYVIHGNGTYPIVSMQYNTFTPVIGTFIQTVVFSLISYFTGTALANSEINLLAPTGDSSKINPYYIFASFFNLPGLFLGISTFFIYTVASNTLVYSSIAQPSNLYKVHPYLMEAIVEFNIQNFPIEEIIE